MGVGDGLPAGGCAGVACEVFAGFDGAAVGAGDAAGEAEAPGCVPGGAGGGFTAAAG